jgi:hypothetical protein
MHHRIEAAEIEHEHDTVISLQISVTQCADLASGYVPLAVKANCMGCLELLDGTEDARRAARPVPKRRKSA